MLELCGVTWRYPSGIVPAVGPVDLEVRPGELVLLTGPTGCGKSTLLRLAAGLLQRHGQGVITGEVRVSGVDPASLPPSARARCVGFVSQEPADQIVSGSLGDEIAFALESAGEPPERIEALIREGLEALDLPREPDRSPDALSGGQRQRLVVASALAAGAGLLLLDEPLAWLDPEGARGLMARLRARADAGLAILMVEHRVEIVHPWADRFILIDHGRIISEYSKSNIDISAMLSLGLTPPGLLELEHRLCKQGMDRASALPRLQRGARSPLAHGAPASEAGPPLVQLERVRVVYGSREALRPLSFRVGPGERVAVLGANGSGKSTLLGALSGRLRVEGLRRGRRVVDVPQEPDLSLFNPTVWDELAYGPREARRSPAEVGALVRRAAEGLSVGDLLDRAPQALSRGQRLRVAVAAALTVGPDVLVLDEPTAGQDGEQVERLMGALHTALGEGAALVFATHDVDLALRYARRVVLLHEGRLIADGPAAEVLTALPEGVPLRLPPLVAWLLESGLPPATPAEVVSWLD